MPPLIKGRDRINKMKSEIIRLIDMHTDNWVKAAFFSDEAVSKIMEELYDRWSKGGERGMPIDYAVESELEILHEKALEYASMTTEKAMMIVLNRMNVNER